jgi:hypothetical protein
MSKGDPSPNLRLSLNFFDGTVPEASKRYISCASLVGFGLLFIL